MKVWWYGMKSCLNIAKTLWNGSRVCDVQGSEDMWNEREVRSAVEEKRFGGVDAGR